MECMPLVWATGRRSSVVSGRCLRRVVKWGYKICAGRNYDPLLGAFVASLGDGPSLFCGEWALLVKRGYEKWVTELEWDVQVELLCLCSEHWLLVWVVG